MTDLHSATCDTTTGTSAAPVQGTAEDGPQPALSTWEAAFGNGTAAAPASEDERCRQSKVTTWLEAPRIARARSAAAAPGVVRMAANEVATPACASALSPDTASAAVVAVTAAAAAILDSSEVPAQSETEAVAAPIAGPPDLEVSAEASPIPLLDTAELLAIAAEAKAMVEKYTPLNVASVSQSPAEKEVSVNSSVQLSTEQAAAFKELELELVLAALGYQLQGTLGSGSTGTMYE